MRYSLSALALTALASSCARTAKGLGINCRGDRLCGHFFNPHDNRGIAESLRIEVNVYVSNTTWYQNNQHIVCVNGQTDDEDFNTYDSICVWYKNTAGIPGNETIILVNALANRRNPQCKICGSVPVYYYKGDNDVKSHGELTFNYVRRNNLGDGPCRVIKGTCHYG